MSNGSKGNTTNIGAPTKGNNNKNLGNQLRHSGGGEGLARCQQRTGHWREAQSFLELSKKAKALERGVAKDPRKKMPTTADLISILEHEYNSLRLRVHLQRNSSAVLESYMQHNTDKQGKLPN